MHPSHSSPVDSIASLRSNGGSRGVVTVEIRPTRLNSNPNDDDEDDDNEVNPDVTNDVINDEEVNEWTEETVATPSEPREGLASRARRRLAGMRARFGSSMEGYVERARQKGEDLRTSEMGTRFSTPLSALATRAKDYAHSPGAAKVCRIVSVVNNQLSDCIVLLHMHTYYIQTFAPCTRS